MANKVHFVRDERATQAACGQSNPWVKTTDPLVFGVPLAYIRSGTKPSARLACLKCRESHVPYKQAQRLAASISNFVSARFSAWGG